MRYFPPALSGQKWSGGGKQRDEKSAISYHGIGDFCFIRISTVSVFHNFINHIQMTRSKS
jgi:hypothetical protein